MKNRCLAFLLASGLGFALVLIALFALPKTARAATLCVNPGGSSGCYASIQAAIDAASEGDVIQVAEGNYLETVVLTRSVILEGGWNSDFSVRDWDVYVTSINAQRAGQVIRVMAGISPTIEGFTITGGDDSAGLGWGGGIRVGESFDGIGFTIIRHNVITNNIACANASCQGEGGGIHVYNNTALIEYNLIISNVANASKMKGAAKGAAWQPAGRLK